MYMHFDTQHVKIGPQMAEIAKIAWNCMNECIKVHDSITILTHKGWNWPKNGWNSPNCLKLCETAWKLHKIAWGSVWMCVKLFPLNFSAGVHAFWYPTCWNWPKNGWYSQNCVILRENCVKLRETQNTACLCQAGSKYISNSPIGLNTAEKSLWTEGNTHTHASVLYIRII